MADLVIVAGNVVKGINSRTSMSIAGATVTAGQQVYADAADGYKLKPGMATSGSLANAAGIALHGAANGQPLTILEDGDYNPGATVVVGQVYVVSPTGAGGVAPISDLTTGHQVTILGVATTPSNIRVIRQASGVAKP